MIAMLNNKLDFLPYAQSGKFVIYGAGQVGITLLRYLATRDLIDNVLNFAVSDVTKESKEIMGVPVYGVTELSANSRVLIAAHPKLHDEIISTLTEHCITDITGISWDCYLQMRRLIPDFSTEIFLRQRHSNSSLLDIKYKVNDLEYKIDDLKNLAILKEMAPDVLKSNIFIDSQNILTKDCMPEFLHGLKKESRVILYNILLRSHTSGTVKPKDSWDLHIETMKEPLYINEILDSIFYIANLCKENDEKALTIKDTFDRFYYYINPRNVTRYIHYLMLRNEQEEASKILYKFKNILTPENIFGYPATSYLASKEKLFKYKLVDLSAHLYSTLIENEKKNILESYLKNKTVAIVGNGPYELETGNGKIIDSYDAVVRFNHFNIESQYKNDYGSKTNIYSSLPRLTYKCHSDIYILAESIHPFSKDFLNSLVNIDMAKLIVIPDAILIDIYKKYHFSWPSSGLRMVYYVKNILGNKFKKEDIFGMALRDNHVGIISDYFAKDKEPFWIFHNFDKELKVLQDLF